MVEDLKTQLKAANNRYRKLADKIMEFPTRPRVRQNQPATDVVALAKDQEKIESDLVDLRKQVFSN